MVAVEIDAVVKSVDREIRERGINWEVGRIAFYSIIADLYGAQARGDALNENLYGKWVMLSLERKTQMENW